MDANIACGRTEDAMPTRTRYGTRAHCKQCLVMLDGYTRARARAYTYPHGHTHYHRPPDTSCLAAIEARVRGPFSCNRGTNLSSHVKCPAKGESSIEPTDDPSKADALVYVRMHRHMHLCARMSAGTRVCVRACVRVRVCVPCECLL